MSRPGRHRFEVPPTAGLPLRLADLAWPRGAADADLGAALAQFIGVEAVQIECSGTAALTVALTALQRLAPERTEVVVPAYTCPLVALAVARCGLQLRLCDLMPEALDLDTGHLARLCHARTLAVMPTHLGGRVVDVTGPQACARAVGAWTIEDAAQALGARTGAGAAAVSVGTRADIGFFSLAAGKGLSIFEGGALLVRDAALREACRAASAKVAPRHIGWELRRSAELLGYALFYRRGGLGLVYGRPLRQALRRGDLVAAAGDDFARPYPLHRPGRWRQAVGVKALARLPDFLAEGNTRAAQRRVRLAGIPGLQVLTDSVAVPGADGTWPVLMVLMPTAAQRDAALQALWGAGLGVSLPFVQSLPDYPQYADVVPSAAPQTLPNARSLASRVLAVSNSPWLEDERFEEILRVLAAR
ncbi:nucleotide sugar aminotransferase [Rhodoferax koreense]|uniref:Nucleotide sugar aminotransferase n=1 Tax=Rhodoferax koreensis TaxID=1842727 RepID=A0A1P8JS40_9BURK|nr:DegT/DnrJ/EryC1/StrS family aminotransferase [Rhodoferax koreense]APW36566.1 nucleotide sugar aminotransferase [Rhodoferax koreense]